ncbi:GDSL-type esterase/lipase family protein [Patescibacteria group bacterium]
MPHIIVFGASVTAGFWDPEGGWVQRLRSYTDNKALLNPKYHSRVYNLGISGDVISDVIRRFEFETQQRQSSTHKTLFLFSVGLNDSQFDIKNQSVRTDPIAFTESLKQLFSLARKCSSNIVFIGFSPVDETRVDPKPWDSEKAFKNDLVEQFENIVRDVCQLEGVHFIGLFKKFANTDINQLLEDGVHPNAEGHKKIFEIVKDYLEKNKLI